MIYTIGSIPPEKAAECGAKAVALDSLCKMDIPIPQGAVIGTDLYRRFVQTSGLQAAISLALGEKPLDQMRWEEIWDLSQKIRLQFLKAPMPPAVQSLLIEELGIMLEKPVVVRSSSVFEDTRGSSFAGLHDSLVNVIGEEAVLNAVKEVWSSLWSDRALLYFKELDLSVEESAMAVVVQAFVEGECSGVCFSESPTTSDHILIEAVPGLNEGLVSGTVSPDRITVDRSTQDILEWLRPERSHAARPAGQGIQSAVVTGSASRVVLDETDVQEIAQMGLKLEQAFDGAQDIEWTLAGGRLFLLQSRPITVTQENDTPLWQLDDKRAWYRSLHVSYDRLMELKQEIQERYFPELEHTAVDLAAAELSTLDDAALENEVARRKQLVEHWEHTYWEMFIPFAHGARLFGEVYNRVMQPENPFEFIELLTHEKMESLQRNHELARIGKMLKNYPQADTTDQLPADIRAELIRFMDNYGKTSFFDTLLFKDIDQVLQLARRFAAHDSTHDSSETRQQSRQRIEDAYLSKMSALGRDDGRELLELARISYRLRDDDNLQVARIEAEYLRAREELARRHGATATQTGRAQKTAPTKPATPPASQTPPASAMHKDSTKQEEPRSSQGIPSNPTIKAYEQLEDQGVRVMPRQITGTSASAGIASGRARIIETADDLFAVQAGEVLVCDSIDPTITFVIPLAAAIVERRGGMLVHGAIIAREYGIPCITGIPEATAIFHNGDILMVDGFLGIVTVLKHE